MNNNLSCFSLFEDFKKTEQEKVYDIIKIKKIKKNDILFLEQQEGGSFYLIFEGLIKIYKTDIEGKENILALLGKGDFFGEMALFNNNNERSASARALQDSLLGVIKKNKIKQLISNNPEIALKIITTLSNRLKKANQQIQDLSFKSVEQRINSVLINLKKQYGEKTKQGILISKRITHQELASLAGTTRGTTTKILNKMKDNNELYTKKGYIYLTADKFK